VIERRVASVSTQQRPDRLVPATRKVGALRLPLLAATAATGVAGLLAVVDPHEAGHYPSCPFLAVSGYYCPGCGSLRAIHDLALGDVGGALARNPLTVVVVVGLAIAWVVWVRRLWRGRPRTWAAPPVVLYGLLTLVLAFWALRNVPGWTWLSPA
jgi:hypothetical protein